MIYLDNQASSPLADEAFKAMLPYWRESFGNPHSSEHIVGWKANDAIDNARQNVAALIGADADEIVFTSGATESNNLALKGIAQFAAERTGHRRIVISPIEHKCIIATARHLAADRQFELSFVEVDSEGRVMPDALERELSSGAAICSIGLVNNEIGTIQDMPRISEICDRYGTFLHTDAAQAPAAIDITDLAGRAHLISLSSHKMYGPMGIGALYIRRELQPNISAEIVGGGQQKNLRSGTVPLPLCVGFGEAARIQLDPATKTERRRTAALRDKLASGLLALDTQYRINGPAAPDRHPGNLNICFVGKNARDILDRLQPHIAASTGSACSSGIQEPSHVLRAIGLGADQAEASIRFSLGRRNTEHDVSQALEIIGRALQDSN